MKRPRRSRILSERLMDKFITVEPEGDVNFWSDILRRINDGKVIPIISNTVRNDRVFELDTDSHHEQSDGDMKDEEINLTVDEQLAEIWAKTIRYPLLLDRFELARVAQFNRVKSEDDEQSKIKYLTFLKKALLNLAEEDERMADLVEELGGQLDERSFSDIVQELDYPRLSSGDVDPLRLLARLPFKIFVTTSYYDFLERALEAEGKKPTTQICFWSGEITNIDPEHRPDPGYDPEVTNPLVYHLHGLERYPRTMVLSEDDYLDFLVAVSQDTDMGKQLIPAYLRGALNESSLILLGYRLQDWDFRVLFRGIVNPKKTSLRMIDRMLSLVIQLSPDDQTGIINKEEARRYLEAYFKPSRFKVEWGEAGAFVTELWDQWNKWRQGML